jgi:hypothetical protein
MKTTTTVKAGGKKYGRAIQFKTGVKAGGHVKT